jgi:two-component sensor histidine kinase
VLRRSGSELLPTVKEAGARLDTRTEQSQSIGILLVDALVSQLGSSASMSADAGKIVRIRFIPQGPSETPTDT